MCCCKEHTGFVVKSYLFYSPEFPGSPVVRIYASTAGSTSSIPGGGTKIPHVAWPKQQKQKQLFVLLSTIGNLQTPYIVSSQSLNFCTPQISHLQKENQIISRSSSSPNFGVFVWYSHCPIQGLAWVSEIIFYLFTFPAKQIAQWESLWHAHFLYPQFLAQVKPWIHIYWTITLKKAKINK